MEEVAGQPSPAERLAGKLASLQCQAARVLLCCKQSGVRPQNGLGGMCCAMECCSVCLVGQMGWRIGMPGEGRSAMTWAVLLVCVAYVGCLGWSL
jgi:hypothetical protein